MYVLSLHRQALLNYLRPLHLLLQALLPPLLPQVRQVILRMSKECFSITSIRFGWKIRYYLQFFVLIIQDYDKAFGNSDLQFLASQGITLTNYYAVTHPSEPNYAAVVGGDYFGIGDDAMHAIPSQVATVVDILEEKGISWAEYQEDMPYTGFQDFNYTVPANDYVEYVRKHNPLV